MQTEELMRDVMIKDWFSTISAKEETRERYSEAMHYFTDLTRKTPTQLIEEAENEIREGKLMRMRQVRRYLIYFKEFLSGRYSPSSIAMYLSAVRSFYRAFEIDLPHNILKERDARPLSRNINHGFNKEIVKKMLFYANIRDRAIILTMKSSGMARQEVVNLTYRQFREGYDKETKITTIYMRRAKVNLDFVTFIDSEGTEAIKEYLRKYGRYFSDGFSREFDETPLFTSLRGKGKITKKNFGIIFWLLAKKMKIHIAAKTRETRKFNPIHSHNLRKFFRTTLLHDGMDDFFINYMMGHKVNNVSSAYFLNDVAKLKETYMQHMDALAIYSNNEGELFRKSRELDKKNKELEAELARLKNKDDTPEKAFVDILEDERFIKQLYEKFKAFAPSG